MKKIFRNHTQFNLPITMQRFKTRSSSNRIRVSRRLLLFAICLLMSVNAFSQTPMVRASFMNGYWVMDVKASNVQAMNTLKAKYSDFNLKELGQQGLESKYRSYLEKGISFYVDSAKVKMNFVSMEFNSAGGNAQFISRRMEDGGELIGVDCRAFQEIDDVLKIVAIMGDQKHVKLIETGGVRKADFTFISTVNQKLE